MDENNWTGTCAYDEAVRDAADEVLWASKDDDYKRDEYVRLVARVIANVYGTRPMSVRSDILSALEDAASRL